MRAAWQGGGAVPSIGVREGRVSWRRSSNSTASACATARAPRCCATSTSACAKGGFYFLTGPSGAGKTSLLKLLYLAQRPTRGRIRLFGEELTDAPREALPPFRRRIGVVFQDFRLIRHLVGVRQCRAAAARSPARSEEEVEGPVREMLAWVGLADRASARPPTLSGGEQQRVAIARAVINRPELLVADEPTGNVDADMAKRLLHLFTALNRLGTTVVVATHDVGLISATPGAQLIRLENGTMVDPTGALRNPPRPPQGRRLMLGWLFASPAERRLLGAPARSRGPTPWVIAIMTFSIMIVAAAGLALANTAGVRQPRRSRRATRSQMPGGGAQPRRCDRSGRARPRE